VEAELLHHGGRAGAWGSLGLWTENDDYFGACTALATAVGEAAGLQRGERVLSVACGDGAELGLWSGPFGASEVVGVEADAARAARADQTARAMSGVTVRVGSGTALTSLGLRPASFDRVLCVDAAYHLTPRANFLRDALALVRPGGTVAFTDLVFDPGGRWREVALGAAARLCGLGSDAVSDGPAQLRRLQEVGFTAPTLQRLDDVVLGGFVRFVERQSGRIPGGPSQVGWRRVATTAWLIPRCRAAGLGYALLTARRPEVSLST
jgi:SAM-dependent methyltransferase